MASDSLRQILVICGPTATGKTSLAVSLANHLRMEVINADSRQMFAGMEIGTAAPTIEERAAVRHHFVGTKAPFEETTAGMFVREAQAILTSLPANVLPVLVGGAGLYISALCDGLSSEIVPSTDEAKRKAKAIIELQGRDRAWEQLQTIDTVAAEAYTDRNPSRIQRALAYYFTTGKRISDSWQSQPNRAAVDPVRIAISMDRDMLYERINNRCECMMTNGLMEETQALMDAGVNPQTQALQSVGYAHMIDVLNGKRSREEALASMQQESRRYAKRQLTWFRRDHRIVWFEQGPLLVSDVLEFLATRISPQFFR
ncbi:MAG: tRNA (adenosine(37)-N6)-dimethylallyltransferase MiaA [Candidatus Kapabacteria bacterium]|nr:tRNA (adenosine(37)-N6)-dimethylallyltransferase MiaA [Candidatus Kapabacteria bacterium]